MIENCRGNGKQNGTQNVEIRLFKTRDTNNGVNDRAKVLKKLLKVTDIIWDKFFD
jgi:hypothetical protein